MPAPQEYTKYGISAILGKVPLLLHTHILIPVHYLEKEAISVTLLSSSSTYINIPIQLFSNFKLVAKAIPSHLGMVSIK